MVPGADGAFTLEEDDASAEPGPQGVARTVIELEWPARVGGGPGAAAHVRIRLEGGVQVVPEARRLRLRLLSASCSGARLCAGAGRRLEPVAVQGDGFTLGGGVELDLGELSRAELERGVEVVLEGAVETPADWRQEFYALLEPARLAYLAKDRAWEAVERGLSGTALLAELEALGLPEPLRSAVTELGDRAG